MKHIPEEKKIEYFINALLKGGADEAAVLVPSAAVAAALLPSAAVAAALLPAAASERAVEVLEVTPHRMVIFKAALNTVKFLQTIINSPVKLVQFVYHAVPVEETVVPAAVVRSVIDYSTSPSALSTLKSTGDARSGALSASASDRPEQLDLTAHEILARIFTEDFMRRFSLEGYVDVEYKMVSNHNVQRSVPSVKRKVGGYELIQLAFSKPKQIINILTGRKGRIDSEDDIEAIEVTSEAKSIFSIMQLEKQVDTVFNVAAFRQMLQHNVRELDGTAPVIAQVENNTYSIELDSLKSYVGHHVSEVVFHPEAVGGEQVYRPIGIPQKDSMLSEASGVSAELNIGKKALFRIGIDVSDSMRGSLGTCVEKLQLVLRDITESTANWKIVLTDFNDASRSSTFDSGTHTLQNLESHVASFSACGMTKLYGTMKEQFSEVLRDYDNYSSVAVIVFTDGLDNVLCARHTRPLKHDLRQAN